MNVQDAINGRRSIKHYDADHRMTDTEKETIFNLAIQSPTAFNIQNWRFIDVSEPKLREEIKAVAWDQAQVTDASMLIILCADLKSWEKEPARYWEKAPQEVQDFLVPAIDGYYRGKDQVQRDEAMRSCGIAAQTIMLAAKELGYDSCPMDGFDYDAVGKLINLPEDHIISMFVAVGKKTVEPWDKPGQLALDDVIIQNKF